MTRASMIAAVLICALDVVPAAAGDVAGTVGGSGRAAVVALEPVGAPVALRPGPPIVMDQKNLAFVPAVLPVVRGTTIEFSNSDDVQHNVFSPSAIAGKFDLGTYGPGATRRVTLTEAGDVLVLCNIHMEMEARILVLDTPYFAATSPDGRYRIDGVPAGAYVLRLWQGAWSPLRRTIDVPATGSLSVDVEHAAR